MIQFEWHLLIPIVISVIGIAALRNIESEGDYNFYSAYLVILIIAVLVITWIIYGGIFWW